MTPIAGKTACMPCAKGMKLAPVRIAGAVGSLTRHFCTWLVQIPESTTWTLTQLTNTTSKSQGAAQYGADVTSMSAPARAKSIASWILSTSTTNDFPDADVLVAPAYRRASHREGKPHAREKPAISRTGPSDGPGHRLHDWPPTGAGPTAQVARATSRWARQPRRSTSRAASSPHAIIAGRAAMVSCPQPC